MDLTVEKIRIYKDLDAITDERSLEKAKARLIDRFGHLPVEVENLFTVVQIRQLGRRLGFETIIFKNHLLIAYFIADSKSPYYKSEVFKRIMDRIADTGMGFEMKQGSNAKLKLLSHGIPSLQEARNLLRKLEA